MAEHRSPCFEHPMRVAVIFPITLLLPIETFAGALPTIKDWIMLHGVSVIICNDDDVPSHQATGDEATPVM